MIPPSIGRITGLVLLALVAPAHAVGQAQELGPFRVLVPDFRALEGADRDFGEDAAEELRRLIGGMVTHQPISRDDIEDALDEVDLRMRDLDCTFTRQLAARISAQVALCASYHELSDGVYSVESVFWDMGSGESFAVDPTTGSDRDEAQVAESIFTAFDRYTTHVRAVANCEAFAASEMWERALTNCDNALAIYPDAVGARYRRARILSDSDRPEEALEELERVIALEPTHEAGLQLAGYVAGVLGLRDAAVDYYGRYLQFSPGDAGVRMRVAYDLAQAGDPEGAMVLIRQGLDLDPADVGLWEQLGGYAFTVAERMMRGDSSDAGELTPGVEVLYRDAIEAYRRVYSARGPETAPRHLRSIAVAHLRLDEAPMAVSISGEAIDIHPDDDGLWSVRADALRRTGRLDQALDALDRVAAINPDYPRLGLRRGNWLVQAGRIPEAIDALAAVAEAEPERADEAAAVVVGEAYREGIQTERYDFAIEALGAARGLPNLSGATAQQLNFWLGYAVFQKAVTEQEPRTLDSARATLPALQRALELLQDVGEYPRSVGVDPDALRANVQQYIEIQEAIIRRGG